MLTVAFFLLLNNFYFKAKCGKIERWRDFGEGWI